MHYIREHFGLVPFHTCYGKARYSPIDGGNAALMDANCHETQQEEKKMGQGQMCACAAEDVSYYFQRHNR